MPFFVEKKEKKKHEDCHTELTVGWYIKRQDDGVPVLIQTSIFLYMSMHSDGYSVHPLLCILCFSHAHFFFASLGVSFFSSLR